MAVRDKILFAGKNLDGMGLFDFALVFAGTEDIAWAEESSRRMRSRYARHRPYARSLDLTQTPS